MGYIYCITNILNQKKYIGKTTKTVEQRFKEHCNDSKRKRCEKRPLYNAMNKYGINNFIVETLKECDNDKLEKYEQYYIKKFNTYGHTGYNATKGGDGSILYDYKKIIELYNSGLNIKQVSLKLNCCDDTVSHVLNQFNIKRHKIIYNSDIKRGFCNPAMKVIQIDKLNNKKLKVFESISLASKWLTDNNFAKTNNGGVRQKISLCCQGKIKSAYGFKWNYHQN